MWLEIKVNTGTEQLPFRFMPGEAESAKTRAERDARLPFSMRHEEIVFLKVGMLFRAGKRCQGPLENFRVRIGRQRSGPLSRIIHNRILHWPGGPQPWPPTTWARTRGCWKKVLRWERTENMPFMRSSFLVSFIQKEETRRHSEKTQRSSVNWQVCVFQSQTNRFYLIL